MPRFIAEILRVKSRYQEEMFRELLRTPCEDWKSTINIHCADVPDLKVDDDPIPERVDRVLQRRELDLSKLREALDNIPIRSSAYLADRPNEVRWQLGEAMKALWPQVLKEATFRSPLLVLDEAHHLKNAGTKLASLFADGKEDVETVSGALAGRFERMIFLTATPFQLGHAELISVLERFNAVQWRSLPTMNQVDYKAQLRDLHTVLDNTQRIATNFDRLWQRLPRSAGPPALDDESLDTWWKTVRGWSRWWRHCARRNRPRVSVRAHRNAGRRGRASSLGHPACPRSASAWVRNPAAATCLGSCHPG